MGGLKNLLCQTHRRCLSNAHLVSSSLLVLRRCPFFTESQPSPNSEPDDNLRKPPRIQTVSYPTKPESQPPPQAEQQQQISESWTRDEMRYMKDAPPVVVSPVSYPARVAPLPEDRRMEAEEEGTRNEELEGERRRIADDNWNAMRRRGVLRYGNQQQVEGEEDHESLPFPKLIKVDNTTDQISKKKGKVVYDLKEAIRLVKKLSGFVRLPHGFGKTYRVDVFAEGAAADEARDAEADVVGGPELVENIQSGDEHLSLFHCIHK
ncbi:hypothetical protein BUALT_Bualt18G0032100 [Buddleja alternifolia]|uniref:Uncharacterized protein n=1 Tax=Buddleja alternifolia TaxID=168488 RepID=A0AAV6W453_9LAMI|nr:hypothetical protein BUALT_Bualt18G0032100 [Buddleja alternifolia]